MKQTMRKIHTWHSKTPEQTLTELETTPLGLSEADAKQRLITYGPNKLPEPKPRKRIMQTIVAVL